MAKRNVEVCLAFERSALGHIPRSSYLPVHSMKVHQVGSDVFGSSLPVFRNMVFDAHDIARHPDAA